MRHIESTHQKTLIQWAFSYRFSNLPNVEPRSRLSDYLFSIPNGQRLTGTRAKTAKAEGLKAGVSDLMLPIPIGDYAGLWIELKRPLVKGEQKPVMSTLQKEWFTKMNLAGYKCVCCFGWYEAREAIIEYIENVSV